MTIIIEKALIINRSQSANNKTLVGVYCALLDGFNYIIFLFYTHAKVNVFEVTFV